MPYGVRLKVWGEYASFNRPEMKVERVSYEVMTPSAARGILESIYWKPSMRWVVDAIHVLKPIRFTHVRRNEVEGKIPCRGNLSRAIKGGAVPLGIAVETHRQQRAATVLRDVAYGIEGHVHVLEEEVQLDGTPNSNTAAKHLEMFRRRALKGQYFHHPYLGTREFAASFKLVDQFPSCPVSLRGERDLGLMLHDILFTSDMKGEIVESNRGSRMTAHPRFFHAVMRDGVITVPPLTGKVS